MSYGEPPYGHAELSSLKSFSQKTGLDLQQAASRLKAAGYVIESKIAPLKDIAAKHGVSPQALYLVMAPAAKPEEASTAPTPEMPAAPPSGTGNLSLDELCLRYGLDPTTVV